MNSINLTRALPVLFASVLAGCSGTATSPTSLTSPTGPSSFQTTRLVTTLDTSGITPTCSVNLAGTPESVTGAGGTFQLTISTSPDCLWAVSSENGTTFSPASGGRGSGVISVAVEANPDHARTTRIDVNGNVVQFTQPNGCRYVIDQKRLDVDASGGRKIITMTTLPGCLWFANASEYWTHAPVKRAEGNYEIPFDFDANIGGERHAFVKIVNQYVPVTQAGR